jgi:hypothetical protein
MKTNATNSSFSLRTCAFAVSLILGGLAWRALAAEETNKVAEVPAWPDYRPWTAGFEIGSPSLVGLFGRWRFSDHVGVRLGFDYAQDSFNDVSVSGTDYDMKIRILAEPLTLDIYPWKKHSWYISFGWLFNQNQVTGTVSDHNGTVIIDGHPFPVDLAGTINLNARQQPVNPYLTIGGNFFYFDRAHRWAFGGEFGVAYSGDPIVSLTRSGPVAPLVDAAVANAQREAQNYANQFKWLPVIKLNVTFSF